MKLRCQLQYLHPQRMTWEDCAQLTSATVYVGTEARRVCAEHEDQVRQVRRAGLLDRLRWSDNPVPARRSRSRVTPGQQELLEPEPAA